MSTPYSSNLSWDSYKLNDWYNVKPKPLKDEKISKSDQAKRALNVMVNQVTLQILKRGVQSIRDGLRLVLKTPIRLVYRPFVEKCWWKTRERTEINAKLAMYSFVQLLSVPAKFLVALVVLGITPIHAGASKWVQDKSANWTRNIDGRMSKLEALKEEGIEKAPSEKEFLEYKKWVKKIDSKLCVKAPYESYNYFMGKAVPNNG